LLTHAAPPPCDAVLLVSAEPIRGACRTVPVIDRFSVFRDGAHAAWLRPEGAVLLSDRANRGDRPWVAPVPTRTRGPAATGMVPAPAEVMPVD
jgi:competence protein ComEC